MLQGKIRVSKKGEKSREVFPVDFRQYLKPNGWVIANETEPKDEVIETEPKDEVIETEPKDEVTANETETKNDSGKKTPEPTQDVKPKAKTQGRAKKGK